MKEATARARVVVTGVVQGVFFRASTREMAVAAGLAGWVANRADGSVEAVFEGSRPRVEDAIEWARHGPRSAVVERVDVAWEEPIGELGFNVKH